MRKWLKDIPQDHKLTQEQVAELAELSRSHYTHIEQGNKSPSSKVAKDFAKVLKFKWVRFFEDEYSLKESKSAC